MYSTQQSNNSWDALSKSLPLMTPPPGFDILETKDGFAYLKHLRLSFEISKSDIKVVTKGNKVYVNVHRGGAPNRSVFYSVSLFSNEKFKKAAFIEDIGLLLLYVTYSDASETVTEHPIL